MNTRDRLVAEGVRILEADGVQALSLRAIAGGSGVSHGAPRRHFPTYAALLAAIARVGVEGLDAELAPFLHPVKHPDGRLPAAQARAQASEALHAAGLAYLNFALTRPHMFTLMMRHDILDGAGGDLRTITATWFSGIVEHLQLAGSEASTNHALALWASVHGITTLALQQTPEAVTADSDPVEAVVHAIDVMLAWPATRHQMAMENDRATKNARQVSDDRF